MNPEQDTMVRILRSGHGAVAITGYPLNGVAVTPDDDNDLATPGYLRADVAGQVKCMPQIGSTAIIVNLAAGEFFPCMVRRVYDTGTDAITLHLFF